MLHFGFADVRAPQPPEPPVQPEQPEQPEQPAEDEDDVSVGEEAGAVVLAMLPWGISILFHAALVLLAFFVIWAVVMEKQEEEMIIPSVQLSKNPGAPLTMKKLEKVKQSSSQRTVTRTTTPTQTSSVTTKVNLSTPLIGVAGSSGGKSSPFGTASGVGSGLNASFFGSGGNAREIVFVVDASGSLLDSFPFVLRELKKTINGLSDQQKFTIIFFQGDKAVEIGVGRPGLKPATPQTKRAAIEWIQPSANNIRPIGGTNPLPGIEMGLKYRPQLMFLLSDNITGGGTGATMYEIDQQELINAIKRATSGRTKINTIQFLYPDPMSKIQGRRGTLEEIAEMTGGVYKFVSDDELR